MKGVIIVIASVLLVSSCSSEQKEKELPSYFCNKNLERYFAGNDSLPIININPNDSFSEIRDSLIFLPNLTNNYDYTWPTFIFPLVIDSNKRPILIRNSFMFYFFSCTGSMPDLNWKYFLEINLTSKDQLLIEWKPQSIKNVRTEVFRFITKRGAIPNYSDNPKIGTIIFERDSIVNPKLFRNTLKEIVNGYIDALDHESVLLFKKQFCNLTELESNEIKKKTPFNFHLEYPETKAFYPNSSTEFLAMQKLLLNK